MVLSIQPSGMREAIRRPTQGGLKRAGFPDQAKSVEEVLDKLVEINYHNRYGNPLQVQMNEAGFLEDRGPPRPSLGPAYFSLAFYRYLVQA